jgi:peptidoglycan/xylan/chitin deacetylase (PgdA/CDA1 family)
LLVIMALLVAAGLTAAWLGRAGASGGRLRVAWALSPASNTVTVRVLARDGGSGRRILAGSRLTVEETRGGRLRRWSGGTTARVPVLPGRRTGLTVDVTGPQPVHTTLSIAAPPPLRLVASHSDPDRLVVSMSSPLVHRARRLLCGTDRVSFAARSQINVAAGAVACRARLRLTAADGETAAVTVTVPARPRLALYCFGHAAGRAIYITIDDGWTPSAPVLALMRRTHLPVTAFLIEQAAREHLSYWRAFVRAGGTIGDHTVSHPDLTKLTYEQATYQWGQARQVLGRWFGSVPTLGRPPYGSFNPTVEAAAAAAGLRALVGWSATVVGHRVQTWNGRPLHPGEIVILHWVPGLGRQMTTLLAAIHARHLNPRPLTSASFSGIAPQRHSLKGD